MNQNKEISKSFNRSSKNYEASAKIQQEIGDRLLERLSYLKMQPRYILDLGCGPGNFIKNLKKLYPKAHVIGVDLAYLMLQQAREKKNWRCKFNLVNADMHKLPFADGVFDLIFSNQAIHWSENTQQVMNELNRIMAKDGCLMFTTLGPDTFKELKLAFNNVDNFGHINNFLDLHIIGDYLLKEYFVDPVMDMEYLTANYPTLFALLSSLKNQGVKNINRSRNIGLTGKDSWKKFTQNMEHMSANKFSLTYEVIYGHAWKGSQTKTNKGVATTVTLASLKKQLFNLNK